MTITPEQIADEEARAQLWRDQAARRLAYQAELRQDLAGDPAAAERVRGAWQAIELWQQEAAEPSIDPQDDPGFDPLEVNARGRETRLSDSVNTGL